MNWLFVAIGETMTSLCFFYLLTLPITFSMAFINYFLFGLKVDQSSSIYESVLQTFRSINGLNRTSDYYNQAQAIYIMSLMITVSFYFYVMFPISIALLLDSFNKTIMALGSITDEPEAEKKVSFS